MALHVGHPAPTLTHPARPREERPTAVAAGVLYLVATLVGLLALAANAPTAIEDLASARTSVVLVALAQLVMALAVTGIAVVLYPLLRADVTTTGRRGLAVGYLASRILEGALFLVVVTTLLAALRLSEDLADLPAERAAAYGPIGDALRSVGDYALVVGQTAFCVGAVLLYWLLFVSRRVPRWLSVWGLLAAPLMLVAGFLLPFTNDPNSTVSSVLYAPLGIQEMVLAVWLIGRGFRPAGG